MAALETYLPTLDPYTGLPTNSGGVNPFTGQGAAPTGLNPFSGLPTAGPSGNPYAGAYAPEQGNWFTSGLKSGWNDLVGLGGAAVAAAGNFAEIPQIQQYGESVEQSRAEASAAAGRPDLDVSPFDLSVSQIPSWLGYQAAKFLPQLVPQLAAHVLVPEGAVPADLARLGAVLPKALGGGALRAAGTDAAKVAAAEAAGLQWGRSFLGATAVNTPVGIGSAYEAAQQAPGGADRSAAGESLLLGPLMGAVGAIAPAGESGILRRGMEGNILQRAATGAFVNASVGAVQSGLQTAITQSMQPDLTPMERAQAIVDSAVGGGAVGGVIGGVLGALRRMPATQVSTETLDKSTEQMLALPAPSIKMGDSADYTKAPEPPTPLLGSPQSAVDATGQGNLPGTGATVVDPRAAVQETPAQTRPILDERKSYDWPFRDQTDEQLQNAANVLDNKASLGSLTQNQAMVREQIRREMQFRTTLEPSDGQRSLFGDLPDQSKPSYAIKPAEPESPEDLAARETAQKAAEEDATRITAMRKTAQDMAGRASQFTKTLDARDLPDLVNAVKARLENGDTTSGVAKIAQKLGILDKDGQERDHAKDLQVAQSMAERAFLEAKDNPNMPELQKKAAELQRQVNEMKDRQAVLDEAERRANEPAAPETPVEDKSLQAAINAPPTGETPKVDISAAPKPAGPAADPAEAADALREHHEQLTSIENDKTLPMDLRRSAAVARDALARGVEGASQKADEVYADLAMHDGSIKFQAGDKPTGSPLSDAAFKAVTDKVLGGLPDDVRNTVQIVKSASDLPSILQAAAARQGMDPSTTRGVHYNGQTYIVRDNVRSAADLTETLKHEVFGHAAARALYGDKFNTVMDQAFQQAGGIDGLRALAKKFNVGDAFEEYIPKGQLGAKDRVALMDEMLAQAAGKASGTFKNAVMSWVGAIKSSLVSVLNKAGLGDLASKLSKMSPSDVAYNLSRMRKALFENQAGAKATEPAFRAEKIHDTIEQLPGVFKGVMDAASKFMTLQSKSDTRKFGLQFGSIYNLSQLYKKEMPEIGQYHSARIETGATHARWASLGKFTVDPLIALEKSDPKLAGLVRKLMGYSAADINPAKKWDDHTWLHSKYKLKDTTKETAADKANRALVEEANETLRKVNQMGGGKLYKDLILANEALRFAQQVVQINELVRGDKLYRSVLPKLAESVMDRFMKTSPTQDTPAALRQMFRGELDAAIKAVKDAHAALPEAPKGPEKNWTKEERATQDYRTQMTKLLTTVRQIETAVKKSDNRPYFHLGRTGDYFVSFTIAHNRETGEIYGEARDAVAKALHDAGFNDAEISANVPNPKVYIRLDTQDDASKLRDLTKKLQQQGHVSDEADIKIGARHDDTPGAKASRIWLDQIKDQISRDPAYEPTPGMTEDQKAELAKSKQLALSKMEALFNDQLSDSNERKVLTERKAVQGFSPDMIRSYARRFDIGANALANMSTRSKISDAFNSMRNRVESARSSNMPASQIFKLADIYSEMSQRESMRSIRPPVTWADTLNAVTQFWAVGFSPSNMLVQLSQVPILGWSELARKHGYVTSARAIAEATPVAFRVLREVFKESAARGWKNLGDANLTGAAMTKAGLDPKLQAFLSRVGLEGRFDLASAARNLARVGAGTDDSKFGTAARLASTSTMYAEVMSRLVMAMAARNLHGGDGDALHGYVNHVLDESMMTYQSWNTARAFGKQGWAGPLTPVMLKFMTFDIQYIEKLYRELGTAFTMHAQEPGARKEALRFLGGHLAALTVLTGTLGLPAAGALAAVYDRTKDLFTGGSSDINADWRNFLASSFGKGVGDVLARGVPHALGFDFSSRVGAQDIVPFTSLLANHAKFQDAAADWAKSMEGAPGSMVNNIISGGIKMYNGQVLEGMKSALPSFLRGPLTSYQMTRYGYVDSKGNRLPMTPGARDILMQAVGLKPAEKANYDEAKLERTNRMQDLTYRAGIMRQNLAVAIERGDTSTAQSLMAKAREWDQSNPAYAVLPSMEATLVQRARARAMDAQFGPAYNPKDLAGRGLTQWFGQPN